MMTKNYGGGGGSTGVDGARKKQCIADTSDNSGYDRASLCSSQRCILDYMLANSHWSSVNG